jgi:uncharacterized protein YdaL
MNSIAAKWPVRARNEHNSPMLWPEPACSLQVCHSWGAPHTRHLMTMLIRPIILLAVLGFALVYPMHGEIGADLPGREPIERQNVLVLYPDAGINREAAELYAVNIANLAGRHAQASLAPIGAYSSGDRDGFAALIVVNAAWNQALPDALLQDALVQDGQTMWIQRGIDQLLAHTPPVARTFGWTVADEDSSQPFSRVDYKGESFTRDMESSTHLARIQVRDTARVEVLAELVGADGTRLPWAVRSDNFTYVVESPMAYANEDDRYLVFADILSAMLAPDTIPVRRALVRIEDIGPEADSVQIQAITDSLLEAGIPFSATIYDTFIDPTGHFSGGERREFDLVDRPFVARALREMVRADGTLIMHGHTHQYQSVANPHFGTSGGDYEFFRAGLSDTGRFDLIGPLEVDDQNIWRQRIDAAFQVWGDADLPSPWAFTFPHYAGSHSSYRAVSERFGYRYERVLYYGGEVSGNVDRTSLFIDQFFPYPVRDIRGDVILPETLGNLAPPGSVNGRSMEAMLETARRNLVLRESYASFFYHWYMGPENLLELVDGLEALGYEFVPLEAAAAVIPPGVEPGARSNGAKAIRVYRKQIESVEFWMHDKADLFILMFVILAHLIVFRIGPRSQKPRRR